MPRKKLVLPTMELENRYRAEGCRYITGCDEAGRGCLAGPVVGAAVILPWDFEPKIIRDSKKLTAKQREEMFEYITSPCSQVRYAVGIVEADVIDRINILKASLLAVTKAVQGLGFPPDAILMDGKQPLPLDLRQECVINGDAKSLSIAAASILAKVTRDRILQRLDGQYPQYGFAKHKGYGTEFHREQIIMNGPCEIHRRSFRGVAEYCH